MMDETCAAASENPKFSAIREPMDWRSLPFQHSYSLNIEETPSQTKDELAGSNRQPS